MTPEGDHHQEVRGDLQCWRWQWWDDSEWSQDRQHLDLDLNHLSRCSPSRDLTSPLDLLKSHDQEHLELEPLEQEDRSCDLVHLWLDVLWLWWRPQSFLSSSKVFLLAHTLMTSRLCSFILSPIKPLAAGSNNTRLATSQPVVVSRLHWPPCLAGSGAWSAPGCVAGSCRRLAPTYISAHVPEHCPSGLVRSAQSAAGLKVSVWMLAPLAPSILCSSWIPRIKDSASVLSLGTLGTSLASRPTLAALVTSMGWYVCKHCWAVDYHGSCQLWVHRLKRKAEMKDI